MWCMSFVKSIGRGRFIYNSLCVDERIQLVGQFKCKESILYAVNFFYSVPAIVKSLVFPEQSFVGLCVGSIDTLRAPTVS